MSREEFALWGVMLGSNAWFARRLILSLDAFKRDVYSSLRELGEFKAGVEERHRLEDGGVKVHLHRRASDA